MKTNLSCEIHETFCAIMADRGKQYSPKLLAIIGALCDWFARGAAGESIGRTVWSLPTGGGKTTVALAAMVALHREGREVVGVVVCQNRIASLEELDAE